MRNPTIFCFYISLTVRGDKIHEVLVTRQLLTNLNIHAVTRVSRLNDEKRSNGNNGSLTLMSVNRQTSFCLSEGSFGGNSVGLSHCEDGSLSQGGPLHQSLCSINSRGKIPLEASISRILIVRYVVPPTGGKTIQDERYAITDISSKAT